MEPPNATRTELESLLRSLTSGGAARRLREIQAVRAECAAMRREPERLRERLHCTAHRFRTGRGEKWCGYASLRDYAAERLGVGGSTFYRWAREGELNQALAPAEGMLTESGTGEHTLAASKPSDGSPPEAALETGSLSEAFPVDDMPSEAIPVDDMPSEASPENGLRPEPTTEQVVRLRVDAQFAPYVRETLRLAGALLGSEVDDEARLSAILAEASSEVTITVSALDALRQLGWRSARDSTVAKPEHQASGNTGIAARATTLDGGRSSRPLTRNEAHSLDLQLRRLIARRRRMRARHEIRLLRFHQQGTHARLGYRRFDEFAYRELGLSPATVFEMLQRARLRRTEDPIAVARATGRIGAIQSSLLHQLRRIGVPRSDLSRWIDLASELTVRSLRDRIAWARDRADTDYRSWSLDRCRPPSDDQLRTSRRLLRELAADPHPPTLLQAPRNPWKRHTTFRWVLGEDSAAFLAQLVVSIQDRARKDGHGRCESWRAFLILCHYARRAWAQTERLRSRREEAVLDRDDWRCAVPGCSSRRSLQRHHIVFASRGGGDEIENLVTLCAFHHLIGVHQGIIAIRGQAVRGSEDLEFQLGLRPGRRPLVRFRGDHRLQRGRVPCVLTNPRLPRSPAWVMLDLMTTPSPVLS